MKMPRLPVEMLKTGMVTEGQELSGTFIDWHSVPINFALTSSFEGDVSMPSSSNGENTKQNTEDPKDLPEPAATCRSTTPHRRGKSPEGALPPNGPVSVSYARYSSDMQDERSIRDQQRRCNEKAAREGYTIVREFEDAGISGANRDRPGYQALLAACRRGEISVIYVESLSRFSRDSYDSHGSLLDLTHTHGVRIATVDDGIDTSTEGWELLSNIHGFQNEQYIKTLSKQVRRTLSGIVLDGYCVGDTRFGYKSTLLDGQTEGKSRYAKPKRAYRIDEDEAVWVRWIFQKYAEERWSLQRITAELNKNGVKRDHRAVKSHWTPYAVRSLLSCPKYIGTWEWGRMENVRNPITGKKSQKERPESSGSRIVRHIPELAIVSTIIFSHASTRLEETRIKYTAWKDEKGRMKGSAPSPFHSSARYLLSGLIECSTCGQPFLAFGNDKKYFRCRGHSQGICPCKKMLRIDLAEKLILREISKRCFQDESFVQRLTQHVEAFVKEMQQGRPEEKRRLRKDLQSISSKIGRLLDLCEADDVPEAKERLADYRQQKLNIEGQLQQLDVCKEERITGPPIEWVTEKLGNLDSILNSDPAAANPLLKAILVGGRIVVSEVEQPGKTGNVLHGRLAINYEAAGQAVYESISSNQVRLNQDRSADDIEWIDLDFTVRPRYQQLAERVVSLWKEGHKLKDIGKKVGLARTAVNRAFNFWHQERGIPTPDGRGGPPRKQLTAKSEKRQEDFMELFAKGALICEIAERFNVCMETVRRHVADWHERHGLVVPDGRNRRTGLKKKTRSKKPSNDQGNQ